MKILCKAIVDGRPGTRTHDGQNAMRKARTVHSTSKSKRKIKFSKKEYYKESHSNNKYINLGCANYFLKLSPPECTTVSFMQLSEILQRNIIFISFNFFFVYTTTPRYFLNLFQLEHLYCSLALCLHRWIKLCHKTHIPSHHKSPRMFDITYYHIS